jgi:hypothetical protein
MEFAVRTLDQSGGTAMEKPRKKSKFRVFAEAAAYVWLGCLLLQPGWVFSQVPFYQGKTITL